MASEYSQAVIITSDLVPMTAEPLPVAPPVKEHGLSVDEMIAKRPSPDGGLFVASCNLRIPSADQQIGAPLVAHQLAAGLGERVRRWYLADGREDELYPADRTLGALLADHAVDMPTFCPLGHPEAVRLVQNGFVHAFLQLGPIHPNDLLMRAGCEAYDVPAVGFVHTIIDKAANYLDYYSGPTFDFDLLISPSVCGKRALQTQLDTLHEALGAKPFAGEIVHIPYGVDTQVAYPDKRQARAQLGWRDEAIVFLSVGRIDRDFKYDPTPLLLTFKALLATLPQARLVLAGSGSEVDVETVETEAKALGIAEQVEIRFRFPARLKPALHAAADVFVAFSDNLQETHGVAVLEAMAAGLPIVAAAWDGYAETVEQVLIPTRMHAPLPIVAGLDSRRAAPAFQSRHTIIDLPDALAALRSMGDAGRRAQLGQASRARVERHYDITATQQRTFDAIVDRVKRARAKPGSRTRPALGVDWPRAFGHYASQPLQVNRVGPGLWPLAELPHAVLQALGVARRPMLKALLEQAQRGSTPSALAEAFPQLDPEAIIRWLVRAAKYGVVSLS